MHITSLILATSTFKFHCSKMSLGTTSVTPTLNSLFVIVPYYYLFPVAHRAAQSQSRKLIMDQSNAESEYLEYNPKKILLNETHVWLHEVISAS
jgi:hypothetical protein